ncbi:MAG TPA: homocysteine S-methyltransferase family protein [Kiloniellales bacterium]|nr:homocysteine S-methyltransferase family protein [Kiloniellales bacterium]
MRRLEEAMAERVLLADGAFRRRLRRLPIDTHRDLWGREGRLEVLCLSRPEWVRGLHEAYLRAGADVIRTHTREASPLSLGPAGLEQEAFYLNYVAAQLACEAVDAVPGRGRRRFVLGLVQDQGWNAGPAATEQAIELQVEALIAGGVDGIALDVPPETGRAAIFLRAARKARGFCEVSAPIYLQSPVGPLGHSSRLLQHPDGVIRFQAGNHAHSDWLGRAVEEEGATLVGGGRTPEDTAERDRRLRLLAEDGLRPLHAAARARGARLEESVVPSSSLHLDPLVTELH